MGGNQSKNGKDESSVFDHLADSNSVRMKHDQKVSEQKGGQPLSYAPRRELLIAPRVVPVSTGKENASGAMKKVPSVTCLEDDDTDDP